MYVTEHGRPGALHAWGPGRPHYPPRAGPGPGCQICNTLLKKTVFANGRIAFSHATDDAQENRRSRLPIENKNSEKKKSRKTLA